MILTTTFFFEAAMASAYLALKLFLVFSIAKLIRPKWAFDRVSSLIAGWLLIQALQSGIILGLSAVSLLNHPYFVAFSLLSASLVCWRTRSLQFDSWPDHKSWRSHLPLISIAFVLFAMWLRSLFFYDYSWDAQTYGIPRLVIWLNYGSLFVHMPTLQLNMFVNEWNAEINAMAYALASGAYLGFGFGNLEVLLVLFFTITWVALLLGAPVFWALCLSAVLGSAPAMLGLASTIKGDLLACTAFVMAFGWLIHIKRGGSSPQLAFGMLLLSSALAVGSKISVVLPVLAIFALATVLIGGSGIRNLWRLKVLTKVGLVAGLLVFSSRFWINWVVYGNPLKRIDAEQARFSFYHMFGNLELAGDRMFGVWEEMQGKGLMWALAGSMGLTAWFIAFVSLIAIFVAVRQFNRVLPQHPRLSSEMFVEKYDNSPEKLFTLSGPEVSVKWLTLVGMSILVTTVAAMTLMKAYPWTFRYFAPGIITLLLGIGATTIRINTLQRQGGVLVISAVLVVVMNFAITSRPGEVLPTPHLRSLVSGIEQASSPLKRISLILNGPYQTAAVEALGLDSDKPLNILAFKDLNTSFIPFLGSHAQNKIQTVANGKDLLITSAQRGWDVVAILDPIQYRDRSLSRALEQQGYLIAVDNATYVIALSKSRVVLTPSTELKELKWSPWNSESGGKISASSGALEVESDHLIETGFISQQLRFNGLTLVRASFEGAITGLGTHAAHLSLHGKQPIITLPTGTYRSSRVFEGIVPVLGEDLLQRLSFGLGGWGAVGSGHLQLTKLEVFQLHIMDGEHASIGAFEPPKE
jgi:uncharacterized protein YneF (UPF0154 family)